MPKLSANELKKRRQDAGMTQKELAAVAGVSYSTFTKLEQGSIGSPSVTVLTNLAEALGCDISDLLEDHQINIAPNKDIEFVYFDVGGVLVHWLPSLHAFAERINRPDNAVKAIFYEFNDAGCRGDMTLEELQLVTLLRLKVPLKASSKQELIKSSWVNDMIPISASHKFICSLVKHHKVGLLTNVFKNCYPEFFERGLVPSLPYRAVVKSCDIGYIKPQKEIYDIATQAAKTDPQKILFIDDSPVNVKAAKSYGWCAEHFDELHPQASIQRINRKYFSGG